MSALGNILLGIVWLSLALLACSGPLFANGAPNHEPPIDRFEAAVKAYEAEDATLDSNSFRQAAIFGGKSVRTEKLVVAIGSSTFARWGKDMETALSKPGTTVINRAFGGSTLPEIRYYAHRLICKYQPDKVLLYGGTNDIGENHHSGQRVFEDYRSLVDDIHECSPETEIIFISMSVPPCRVEYLSDYIRGNQLIREYSAKLPYLRYVDVTNVMDTADGLPKKELFDPSDNLHMNEAGYKLWLPILQRTLQD
jgi:lysophospholipase L1-like esterase